MRRVTAAARRLHDVRARAHCSAVRTPPPTLLMNANIIALRESVDSGGGGKTRHELLAAKGPERTDERASERARKHSR